MRQPCSRFGSTARADSGTVHIRFLKAGWVIGGTVGAGTLTFRGRTYPLSIGGLSYGLTFGGAVTNLRGRVSNIFDPRDVAGVYGAGAAGAAVIRGPQAVDPHQPARRGDGAFRQPDRADGESRSERHGGVVEVGACRLSRAKARSASSRKSPGHPRLQRAAEGPPFALKPAMSTAHIHGRRAPCRIWMMSTVSSATE